MLRVTEPLLGNILLYNFVIGVMATLCTDCIGAVAARFVFASPKVARPNLLARVITGNPINPVAFILWPRAIKPCPLVPIHATFIAVVHSLVPDLLKSLFKVGVIPISDFICHGDIVRAVPNGVWAFNEPSSSCLKGVPSRATWNIVSPT
jgi:hypothetical protein